MPSLILLKLNRFYIISRGAFFALHDVKTNPLPLRQCLKTTGLDRTEMNEQIFAIILFNEAETFLLIEPLHFTFCHLIASSFHIIFSRMKQTKQKGRQDS